MFSHFKNRILTGVFFICLSMPMIIGFLGPLKTESKEEKRTLAQWPKWIERKSIEHYFEQISTYTQDHFGLRELLIISDKKMKWVLNESPSSSVIRGEDNWLFLKIRDPLLSRQKYSTKTMMAFLEQRADYVANMHERLNKKGIIYRHIVAANKMTVYPEYLPNIFKLTDINASLSHFKNALNNKSNKVTIYSDEVLANYKSKNSSKTLYFKNDSHWNDLGAYQVFLATIKNLHATHSDLPLLIEDKDFTNNIEIGGDLANLIGLPKQLTSIEPTTQFLDCAVRSGLSQIERDLKLSKCGKNTTRIMVIGDSFATLLYQYFAESVGELMIIDQATSRYRIHQLIDKYKPDVVIEEIVERNLSKPVIQ